MLGAQGRAVHPGGFECNGLGIFRDAAFLTVKHGNDGFDRDGAEAARSEIESGTGAGALREIEIKETHLARDLYALVFQPRHHVLDVANDDIGTMALEPSVEALFVDLRSDEGRHLAGFGLHSKEGMEGRRPFAFDSIVLSRFETKADAAITAFGQPFERVDH